MHDPKGNEGNYGESLNNCEKIPGNGKLCLRKAADLVKLAPRNNKNYGGSSNSPGFFCKGITVYLKLCQYNIKLY